MCSVALVVLKNLSLFYLRRSLRTKSAYCITSALWVWLKISKIPDGLDLFLERKSGENQVEIWLDSHTANFKYDVSNKNYMTILQMDRVVETNGA